MSKEELMAAFERLFPNWIKDVVSYKKIGSKCLSICFKRVDVQRPSYTKVSMYTRVFLYKNDNDWHFGTKLYRKRPDKIAPKCLS